MDITEDQIVQAVLYVVGYVAGWFWPRRKSRGSPPQRPRPSSWGNTPPRRRSPALAPPTQSSAVLYPYPPQRTAAMNTIFALLLSVSPADRADWPESWECSSQYDLCVDSIANLKMWRAARGYEDGRWDEWVRQAEGQRDAWGILSVAESSLSDLAMCRSLLAYKRLVGDYRYLRRYRPPMFKESYPYPPLAPVASPTVGPPRPPRTNKVRQ